MQKYPLSQSAPKRALNDTVEAQRTARFMWSGEAVLAVAGGTWLVNIASVDASTGEIVIRSVFGGLGGLATAFFVILVWNFFRAPYKQRNQARELVEQQKKPSDSEVTDIIGLLETEKLELKHNNGEERSYSFTEIFLAIADQLCIGISSTNFETIIKNGLPIDEKEEWYFPYEDEGITHLIGVLVQNTLIECRNEEYQHMQREVVSGMTGIYMTPDAHLVKDTTVKYYLLPLGSRVIQQLRQQATSHKEGSENQEEPRFEIIWLSENFFLRDSHDGYRPCDSTDEEGKISLVVRPIIRVNTLKMIQIQSMVLEVGSQKIPWNQEDVNVFSESGIVDDVKFEFPLNTPRGKQLARIKAIIDGQEYTFKPFLIDFPRKVFK